MELGIILPSYRNLLRISDKDVTESKIQRSKADSASENSRPKNAATSIANQGQGRVIDVSI